MAHKTLAIFKKNYKNNHLQDLPDSIQVTLNPTLELRAYSGIVPGAYA